MTRFLHWSLRAYGRLLIFYPEDLRRDFGPEMLEAFARDLSFESSLRGLKGAIRVWRIALREVIAIGLPVLWQAPAFVVPALSAATAIVFQSPMLIWTIRRDAQSGLRPGDATFDAVIAVAIAAAVTALTSFFAVYRRKRSALISIAVR